MIKKPGNFGKSRAFSENSRLFLQTTKTWPTEKKPGIFLKCPAFSRKCLAFSTKTAFPGNFIFFYFRLTIQSVNLCAQRTYSSNSRIYSSDEKLALTIFFSTCTFYYELRYIKAKDSPKGWTKQSVLYFYFLIMYIVQCLILVKLYFYSNLTVYYKKSTKSMYLCCFEIQRLYFYNCA